jgi:CheY-like chemotaxis protein
MMALIMIIDDDEVLRRTVRRFLVGNGHTVIEAEHGGNGVALLREHDPAIVITDIYMPEKEGMETIVDIRKLRPATRIIAMSGGGPHRDALALKWAQGLGADAVLPKPFRAAELNSAVEHLLNSSDDRM